jgi:hypothetical protein
LRVEARESGTPPHDLIPAPQSPRSADRRFARQARMSRSAPAFGLTTGRRVALLDRRMLRQIRMGWRRSCHRPVFLTSCVPNV